MVHSISISIEKNQQTSRRRSPNEHDEQLHGLLLADQCSIVARFCDSIELNGESQCAQDVVLPCRSKEPQATDGVGAIRLV